MAQTRRKRKHKHRGTPAGTIERRGRTSKPPETSKPKKKKGAARPSAGAGSSRAVTAAERRAQRLETAPTWRGAINRAAFAAIILVLFIAVVQRNIAAAVVMGAFAMVIYVPMSYYTDLALYRRRQRKKQQAGG